MKTSLGRSQNDAPLHDEGSITAHSRFIELALTSLRFGPGLTLVILVLILGLCTEYFFTARNFGNVLAQTATIAVLAMG